MKYLRHIPALILLAISFVACFIIEFVEYVGELVQRMSDYK